MIKRIVPVAVAILSIALISNTGCKSGGGDFQTKDGLEYKMIKDNKGKKAVVGDVVEMNVVIKIEDSVLGNSRKDNGGKPVQMPLAAPMYHGDWLTGLSMMGAGDSAIFRVSVDSIKKAFPNQPMPPFMKSGKHLVYEVSMVSVKSQADMKSADDQKMKDFFQKNNIQPQKTASGLYYTITTEGTGPAAQKGDSVSIKYVGKTLDGHIFDTNIDSSKGHMKPFIFPVGRGAVIPGMDEGAMLIKKGGKGVLYIPSAMAYGAQSPSPEIPANSSLIFEMEVIDVKH